MGLGLAALHRRRVNRQHNIGAENGRRCRGSRRCEEPGSVYLVFKPTSPLPYLVFPALVMGLTYALVGTFGLLRFTWIGAGIFVAVMLGYLLAPALMPFWIAAAGGGGLILGGLWMRTV
jgi:hypothetical protein